MKKMQKLKGEHPTSMIYWNGVYLMPILIVLRTIKRGGLLIENSNMFLFWLST